MHFIFFLLLSIFMVVCQTTFVHDLPDYLGRPDFIYILIAFYAYKFSWGKGGLLVFLTGWMLDVLSSLFLGAYVVESLFLFICLKMITTNNPVRESAYQIPLIGVSYFLMQLVIYLFCNFVMVDNGPVWSWVKVIKETVEIIFVAIPCFLLFNSFHEYIETYTSRSKIAKRKPENRFR